MNPPRLIILGSSSGLASAHRASSSYLLDLNTQGIMIDCGDGATRNFLAAGYRAEWVSHIVVSHTHADHVCGLPYFVQQRHLAKTSQPLTIHCAPESIGALRDLLVLGHLYPEWLPFDIHWMPIMSHTPWDSCGLRLTAFPTTHLNRQRIFAREHGYPDPGDCYAFHIDISGRSLVYSSDLGNLIDLDPVPQPIDWLLIETTHVPLDELWPWAEAHRVERVILTHLSDEFDDAQIALTGRFSSNSAVVAHDLMLIELS